MDSPIDNNNEPTSDDMAAVDATAQQLGELAQPTSDPMAPQVVEPTGQAIEPPQLQGHPATEGEAEINPDGPKDMVDNPTTYGPPAPTVDPAPVQQDDLSQNQTEEPATNDNNDDSTGSPADTGLPSDNDTDSDTPQPVEDNGEDTETVESIEDNIKNNDSEDPSDNSDGDSSSDDEAPVKKGDGSDDELLDVKQQALQELKPIVDTLELPAEERFETLMMIIRASDDKQLVKPAMDAAHDISDENKKARALLDVVNEVNYLTHNKPDET